MSNGAPPQNPQGLPLKLEQTFKITILDDGFLTVGTTNRLIQGQQGTAHEVRTKACQTRSEVIEELNNWCNEHGGTGLVSVPTGPKSGPEA